MTRPTPLGYRLAVLAVFIGCGGHPGGIPSTSAGVPEGYPQINTLDNGVAALVVNGVAYTADMGIASYDSDGIDPTRLRATILFDVFDVYLLSFDEGEYSVARNEVEASWSESNHLHDSFEADATCGSGTINVVGQHPGGFVPDNRVVWGTIQLGLCPEEGGEMLEMSGRFTVRVLEI